MYNRTLPIIVHECARIFKHAFFVHAYQLQFIQNPTSSFKAILCHKHLSDIYVYFLERTHTSVAFKYLGMNCLSVHIKLNFILGPYCSTYTRLDIYVPFTCIQNAWENVRSASGRVLRTNARECLSTHFLYMRINLSSFKAQQVYLKPYYETNINLIYTFICWIVRTRVLRFKYLGMNCLSVHNKLNFILGLTVTHIFISIHTYTFLLHIYRTHVKMYARTLASVVHECARLFKHGHFCTCISTYVHLKPTNSFKAILWHKHLFDMFICWIARSRVLRSNI